MHPTVARCGPAATMRSARWAWGTASSVPSSTQPSPAARGLDRRHGRRTLLARAAQRGGEHHVAGHHAGQPGGLLGLGAEAGQGQRTEHERGPQRHGGHHVALRLEQQAELGQPVAGAAVGLGHGQPEQVGRRPAPSRGRGRCASVLLSTAATRSGSTRPAKQPGGRLGDRQLLVGECEVHQAPFPSPAGRHEHGQDELVVEVDERRPAAPCRSAIVAGSMPSMLATTRVPSSSSTSPMGSG